MIIPKKAGEYIKIQRGLKNADTLLSDYVKGIEKDYEQIAPYLPVTVNNILDIGCGVAGINVFLSKHYNHDVDIHLIDRTFVEEKIWYGYQDKGSFYNSMDVAKELLMSNGVSEERIHLQEATGKNEILFDVQFDVVISLLSWGFHYPLGTYMAAVNENICADGVVILDVREGTVDTSAYTVIHENKKGKRICLNI